MKIQKLLKTKLVKNELSDFHYRVYLVVAKIPGGKTMTYKEVAAAIGNPRAYRAVGNALNRNPFAPKVPCHRVIKSDKTIGGFNGGVSKKIKLLRHEGADLSR